MSKRTPEEQSAYYREWYKRKREDPEWVAKRAAYTAEYEGRESTRERRREYFAERRRRHGARKNDGPGSWVPLDEQRRNANAWRLNRYHSDPEFKAQCVAMTKAARERRKAAETPEEREARRARERIVEARYKAKMHAKRDAERNGSA